jgi:hypothetical protein
MLDRACLTGTSQPVKVSQQFAKGTARMSYVLSHDMFAARGDDWSARARKEQKPSGLITREVRGPNWHELSHRFEVEGFDPDGEPVKVSQRWTVPSPERREVERSRHFVDRRNENAPTYRPPEYRRVVVDEVHGRHPEAREVPLTEEQLRLRTRQRAAVQARMTRAANKAKREREEAMNILLSL